MRHRIGAGAALLLLVSLLVPPAAAVAGEDSSTVVFRTRFTGLVASATWTTCPQPSIGDVCTDTVLLAFDSRTRDGKLRSRGPVVRTLTFVYRVVGGELGTVPVAEWFGRTEDATVEATPRLERASAQATVPILICTIFEPESGLTCPDSLAVDVAWTGTGPLERIAEHAVVHMPLRLENTWTRGWQRTATAAGTVGTGPLGVLIGAELIRADQGEIIVQHPFE